MPPAFDPREYHDPRPNRLLIRALEPVSRIALRYWLRVRSIDLPAADLTRLRRVVNPRTAAILAPLHPEFLTDWLIDKELAARVSPLMAHWAAYEIVNAGPAARGFWLANNLVANAPGGGGREYSVRWALQGHGVLLHPEGTATWHARHVGTLLPGAVDMAWEAAGRAREAGGSSESWLVPLVWALRFPRSAERGLAGEIDHVARGLGLPRTSRPTLEGRFADLQCSILMLQHRRFGEPAPDRSSIETGPGFFAAQRVLQDRLLRRLEARHGRVEGDLRRQLHAFRRSIREAQAADPAGAREDRSLAREIDRLSGFTADRYGAPSLTQEEIAESLKRLRVWLLGDRLVDRLHAVVPVAVAPRIAHVRVPEPIAVHSVWRPDDDDAGRERLLAELRDRMQGAVDELHAALAPLVDPFRRPNPFTVGTLVPAPSSRI